MGKIQEVDPFRCRMWQLHDRLESQITVESCGAEIESTAKHGQLIPALGRRLENDPACSIELIYGARRLLVARHLNIPLRVEVRELCDREAIVAMDLENRVRRDLSPYERGMSFSRWLRAGKFQSQEELAQALRVSPSQVSRLLKLAHLPAVIVNAFRDPAEICEGWGLDLIAAIQDPKRRELTVRKARSLAGIQPRPQAGEVYRQLVSAEPHRRGGKAICRDHVVRDPSGRPMLRIRQLRSSVALLLPADEVSARTMGRICDALRQLLDASA